MLIDESKFVLLIEMQFFMLHVFVAELEEFNHSGDLKFAVALFDGQFDVLLVVLVDGESFHFDDVD